MARRISKAQQIANGNEEEALAFFNTMLQNLPDPRRPQGLRYPLRSVVVIALMASVCGSDNGESMELWGQMHEEWLSELLPLPHGVPTQDVYLSVFAALNPDAFSEVFVAWSKWLSLRLKSSDTHIAIDGKTSRRSRDKANGVLPLHLVSAWSSEAGIVLGQQATDKKSNEITAIPHLLDVLDLKGATVTIDAMGCQRAISEKIVSGKGNFLLSVKENQPTLAQQVRDSFLSETKEGEALEKTIEEVVDVDGGHGRVETRTVRVVKDAPWMSEESAWPHLSFCVEVVRERWVATTDATSTETSYYIGSDENAAIEQTAKMIRGHWAIENSLHWVLDMAFREDEARHRAKNTAANMATLRHFALNLLKQDKTRKVGIAISRQRAGWDKGYLIQLLTSGAS